jgi:hypothetical protein
MKTKTKSLLEELETLSKTIDTKHIIEQRANNVIASAIHLMEVISRNYDEETTAALEKRLLMSIKGKNDAKFKKFLRQL